MILASWVFLCLILDLGNYNYVIMKSIILINLFIFLLNGMDVFSQNIKSLIYENFMQKEIYISDELDSMKIEYYFSDSILVDAACLINLPEKQKSLDRVFNILYEQDVINEWDVYHASVLNPYSDDHMEFIKMRKQEICLYYLGKIKVSNHFDSYLIEAKYGKFNEYNVIRNVFLINSIDNKIKSISRISRYTCFDGNCNHIFSKISDDNIFILKDETISSDLEIPDEESRENEAIDSIFSFNKDGYLIFP
jgi:hypothetical protein